MKAQGLFMVAGGTALAGNAKKAGGFPDNGYATVAATVALVFLASLLSGSRYEPPFRGLAALSVIVALFYYAPILSPSEKKGSHRG